VGKLIIRWRRTKLIIICWCAGITLVQTLAGHDDCFLGLALVCWLQPPNQASLNQALSMQYTSVCFSAFLFALLGLYLVVCIGLDVVTLSCLGVELPQVRCSLTDFAKSNNAKMVVFRLRKEFRSCSFAHKRTTTAKKSYKSF